MAAQVQVFEVGSPYEIDQAISAYLIQGYVLANRTQVAAWTTAAPCGPTNR